MKRILALILTICMVITLAPVTIFAETTDLDYTGGTLIADYTLNEAFSNTELGEKVIKELNTNNTNYDVTYSDDGVTVKQSIAATDTSDASAKLAINLSSLVSEDADDNTGTYQQGFVGTYAFEITFSANLIKSGANRYWNLYLCDEPDKTTFGGAEEEVFLAIRNDNKLRVNNATNIAFSNYSANVDKTIRFTVDTVTNTVYGYEVNDDGSYTEKGSVSTYTKDALSSLTLVTDPRQVAIDSQITFKNIKIYEIERYVDLAGALEEVTAQSITGNAEGLFTEDLTLPESSKGYAISWESLNTDIISNKGVINKDYEITEDTEVTFKVTVSYEGKSEYKEIKLTIAKQGSDVPSVPEDSRGKMIINYDLNKEFSESYLGEKVIVDRYDLLKQSDLDYGFATTYTDNGITIEHTEEALFAVDENTGKPTTATFDEVDGFGLNLAYLFEDDTGNNTKTYQTGVTGVYDIELTMVPEFDYNTSKSKGANPLMDFYFDDNLLYEDNETWDKYNRIKMYSSGKTQYSGNTTISFPSFVNGKELKIRFVIDTDNKMVTGYSMGSDGVYVNRGTSNYTGEVITSIWIRFRTYFEKGDKLTLKNLTIYEKEKSTTSGAAVAISTFNNTLPDSFVTDPNAVTENIVIPANISDVASSVETSNEKIITTKGVIKRGFTDRTATLDFSGSADGVAYNRMYTLVIKARDDLNIVPLTAYDFKTQNAVDNIMYVGDSVLTDKGFKVVNTKGLTSQAIGMLEYEKSPDTYIYDHSGAYDVELSVIPELTSGRAYLEIGNYNPITGNFVPYNRLYIGTDGIVYADKYDDIDLVTEATAGNPYNIKMRVDLENHEFWTWVNGVSASDDGFEYDATADILNAYKIGFEEDAGINDSVTLTNGNLVQQVPAATVSLEGSLAIADSIKVTDIVNNPDDASGDITLPTFEGYNIEWSTDNSLADLEAKKIYRTSTNEDITLTAIISAESNPEIRVKKDFHIKVSAATDPAELLEGALAKLTAESVTNQNPDALVADLKLPLSQGDYSIEWKSLSPEYIEYIDGVGKINNKINIAEPTEVTLEATMSLNGTSKAKNVKFTIAKRGADVTLTPADITTSAEGVVTYKATVPNTNGTVYLKDDEGNNIIGFTVNNSKLSFDYKNTDNSQIDISDAFNIEVIMNSADRCATVIVDDKVVLDYVPYISAAGGFKTVSKDDNISLENESVVFDEYSLFDYNMKLYGYLDVLENIYVTGNLNLKKDAIGGVNVDWTSSDEVVMTNEGIFDAPEAISFFDIVFKMSMENGTDATYSEKIACVAVPSTDLMQNAVFSSDVLDDAINDRSKLYDNDYSTYLWGKSVTANNYITIDLGSSMDVTSLYFFQSSEDGGMNSCDIYLSNDGVTWSAAPVASATFSDLKSNYVYFGLNKARYVKITNISADNNNFKLYELKAFVAYSSDNKANFDIMALNMPTEYELTQTSITLPKTGAKYGSVMTWSSSDPLVISTDGTVTRPVYSKEVVLTVTAEFGGKTATSSYMYLVKGTATSSTPGGGAGGGGGGSYAGNIAGVNTGGTGISAQPQENGVELDKVEYENAPKGIFNDVNTTEWYYDYLVDLKEKGIVSGYEDGNFYPNNQVTREEFLKMLISATGTEITDEAYVFADVDADDWFAPYVYTAKANGIAKGMDENTFGVGMSISRQDMSVMVYNILGANIELADDTEMFADHSDIALYAFNAVYAMKTIGVLSGYESGEFIPNGNLTRAEATKVISLIMKMQ